LFQCQNHGWFSPVSFQQIYIIFFSHTTFEKKLFSLNHSEYHSELPFSVGQAHHHTTDATPTHANAVRDAAPKRFASPIGAMEFRQG
jgi:hypothetical protein